ncbi:MAG: AlpA family phage regulatory protein [Burkholderiales bacterium]|nr:AlpA family phage regulatory protein [Burkholderiales bacterium]
MGEPKHFSRRLLGCHEAAAVVGLRRTRFLELVAEGKLPQPVRVGGRSTKWIEGELDQIVDGFIAERNAGQQPQIQPPRRPRGRPRKQPVTDTTTTTA